MNEPIGNKSLLATLMILLSTLNDVAMSQTEEGPAQSNSTATINITAAMSQTEEGPAQSNPTATIDSTEASPPEVYSVGPTTTTSLSMTLYGISELRDPAEWSQLTAEYAMDYFNTGGGDITDAAIQIWVTNHELVYPTDDHLCGCPGCNEDVWSTGACDEFYYCSPCGARINFLQDVNDQTERESCSQIAGLEFQDACGACNPLTCTSTTYCGCPLCTDEVWATQTCDDEGFCSSCGERITYLYARGNLERDACIQTAGIEWVEECGACNPETCNQPTNYCECPSCTEEVWNTEACDANGYCSTCGERIDFLHSLGSTQRNACMDVAGNDHPDVCGECNPAICVGGPEFSTNSSSHLEDTTVLITYTQTSSFKTTSGGSLFVVQEPFVSERSRTDYISYLKSQSSNYDDVLSSSNVTLPPGVEDTANTGGDSGGGFFLGTRNIIIICVGVVIVTAIIIRETLTRDRYAEGVGDYLQGLYANNPRRRGEATENADPASPAKESDDEDSDGSSTDSDNQNVPQNDGQMSPIAEDEESDYIPQPKVMSSRKMAALRGGDNDEVSSAVASEADTRGDKTVTFDDSSMVAVIYEHYEDEDDGVDYADDGATNEANMDYLSTTSLAGTSLGNKKDS